MSAVRASMAEDAVSRVPRRETCKSIVSELVEQSGEIFNDKPTFVFSAPIVTVSSIAMCVGRPHRVVILGIPIKFTPDALVRPLIIDLASEAFTTAGVSKA